MMKVSVVSFVVLLGLSFLLGSSECTKQISKCFFFDKRNKEIKQTFYIPTDDVNMYKQTIQKMLSREFEELAQPMDLEGKIEEGKEREDDNISNMDEIKKKEEMKKRAEMKERLVYLEKYRKYVKNILKNIEFKCESINDYETKIKCNLCIYTEIVNKKHIRQGQIVQIFMNECMYGFYYYDNMSQYCDDEPVKKFGEYGVTPSNKSIDDVYLKITKDVMEGKTEQINFFRKETSTYHPVCYVSE